MRRKAVKKKLPGFEPTTSRSKRHAQATRPLEHPVLGLQFRLLIIVLGTRLSFPGAWQPGNETTPGCLAAKLKKDEAQLVVSKDGFLSRRRREGRVEAEENVSCNTSPSAWFE